MSESNYKSVITKPPTKNNQPFKKKAKENKIGTPQNIWRVIKEKAKIVILQTDKFYL